MDVKRLEELAAWCDRQMESLEAHEIIDIAANYADLARCAKAWAKVERMLMESPILEIRNTGKKRVVESRNRLRIYEDSVVEAVEAAPEVTDAK